MTKTIRINLTDHTDFSYDIKIGVEINSILKNIGESLPQSFVITDSNVYNLYIKAIKESFSTNRILVVQAGEKSKNRKTKEMLENKLLSMNVTRDSLIVACGGGVIGDLAGFVAATLLRGVPFIQIPTTLLSQVDSSIGGKVAVDHPLGKNLIGAFYNPKKVYIDVNALKTLSEREFRSGMAEVIKYAAILDQNLFSFLLENHANIIHLKQSSLIHIISRCCELKKMIVEKDERETGLRRVLNFGHTIGHAVESLSKYKLTHGEAISIGMAAEAKISASLGILKRSDMELLTSLLELYKLPTLIPSRMNLKKIIESTIHDKKVQRGKVYYTLLEQIGKARVGVELTSDRAIKSFSK
jgi:3-dehydroquinate synthase